MSNASPTRDIHQPISDKAYKSLRPSELVAYENPHGYVAREFLGSCTWTETKYKGFSEALEHCFNVWVGGGRPMLAIWGVNQYGEECRCNYGITHLLQARLKKRG